MGSQVRQPTLADLHELLTENTQKSRWLSHSRSHARIARHRYLRARSQPCKRSGGTHLRTNDVISYAGCTPSVFENNSAPVRSRKTTVNDSFRTRTSPK